MEVLTIALSMMMLIIFLYKIDLNVDNVAMLAKRLSQFPWDATKMLADELNAMILQKDPGTARREWIILTMLVQWENDHHNDGESLRKMMAWKLHDAGEKYKWNYQRYDIAQDFIKLARDLDMHGMSSLMLSFYLINFYLLVLSIHKKAKR